MPRYHFHLSDGVADPDVEGYDLPDLETARRAAAQLIGQLLVDNPKQFWSEGQLVLTATDDQQLVLFTIRVDAGDAPVLKVAVMPNPE